jgi:hypothetical protein
MSFGQFGLVLPFGQVLFCELFDGHGFVAGGCVLGVVDGVFQKPPPAPFELLPVLFGLDPNGLVIPPCSAIRPRLSSIPPCPAPEFTGNPSGDDWFAPQVSVPNWPSLICPC